LIAVPIVGPNTKTALSDIKKAQKVADILELRLDLIKDVNEKNLARLLSKTKKLVIVTDRKYRLPLIKQAIEADADYIDLDISIMKKVEPILNELKKTKKSKKTKLIVSFHNFKSTNKQELLSKYQEIRKLNPDIIKLVSFANSINDNAIVLDLIKKAKNDNKEIIALCMGEKGEISRILSPIFGSFLTFGSLKSGKESAPGQILAETLRQVYRIDKLKAPKIFGLVGNPIKQSKGIYLHNEHFKKTNANSIYVNFLVDDASKFIETFRSIISGLSITIPFKMEMIRSLDKVDQAAKEIGAVNTVIKQDGKLIGYNTDVQGAIDAIEKKASIEGKDVLMIGAGGVARAVGYGIIKEGGKLTICNRTKEKAIDLAEKLNCSQENLLVISKKFDIIINCTSIGMYPKIEETPLQKPLLKNLIKKDTLVFDTVYNPRNTKLLKDAQKLGCNIVGGYDMFIAQALEQQKLFQQVK